MPRTPFDKAPLSVADQVRLMQSRGMCVTNPAIAQQVLLQMNFYRFNRYARPYETPVPVGHDLRYVPGTTYGMVVRLASFDSELRALLFRYIEPVEIAFRSAVCYEMAMRTHDAHWYLDPHLYRPDFDYLRAKGEWTKDYRSSREPFAKRYGDRYSEPALPPTWIMCEILSLGSWSLMYSKLANNSHKRAVSAHFELSPYYLGSWIHVMSVLRNMCAHHGRVWNRRFAIKPRLPKDLKTWVGANDRLAAQIAVLSRLVEPLGQRERFEQEWQDLLARYPHVSRRAMGIEARA